MKCKIIIYEHRENGISLQIIPETDEEESLLKGLFKHGQIQLGHPGKENGGLGFYIAWMFKP